MTYHLRMTKRNSRHFKTPAMLTPHTTTSLPMLKSMPIVQLPMSFRHSETGLCRYTTYRTVTLSP
jgi:hypothetical protein